MWLLLLILIILVLLLLLLHIKIVPQEQVYVIERFGTYYMTWESGFHLLIPFLDRIANKIPQTQLEVQFQPQLHNCHHNKQMNLTVFYHVTNAKRYTYGLEVPVSAIEKVVTPALQAAIEDIEFDQILSSKESINDSIVTMLAEPTSFWGIRINRVELETIARVS